MWSVVRNDKIEKEFSFEPTTLCQGDKETGKNKISFFHEPLCQFDTDVNIKEVFVKTPVTLNGSEMIIGLQCQKFA